MEVLFKTIHGSRLYGLSNEHSDEDFYTVVSKPTLDNKYGKQHKARFAKQKITGHEDSFVVDFGTWVEMCKSGVPQALEAMFSNMAIEDKIENFRQSWIASSDTHDRYLRTIKSFAYSDKDPYKRKRHAMRLAYNLADIRATGRFNPTLSENRASLISMVAHSTADEVHDTALHVAWA